MIARDWQRVEGGLIARAGLGIWLMVKGGLPLWASGLILFAPDLAILGYLAGPRLGAFAYNLTHLYAGGLVFSVLGVVTGQQALIAAGALWTLHVGVDRLLGYGLKAPTGFHDTHLGRIGR